MKKLFSAMILMVLGVVLIPTVQNSVDNYDIVSKSETFTASNDSLTAESFVLAETPTEVTSVTVNGNALTLTTDYTVSGSTVSLVASASDTGDTVVISYDYQYDMPASIDSMVDITLIIFVIAVVIGGVTYIKIK